MRSGSIPINIPGKRIFCISLSVLQSFPHRHDEGVETPMNISFAIDDLSWARRPGGIRLIGLLVGLWALVGVAAQGRADPIPKGEHNRRIDIRLTPEAVVVKYQLNVEPFTAHIEDVPTVAQGGDFENIRDEEEYFKTFVRLFGPRRA